MSSSDAKRSGGNSCWLPILIVLAALLLLLIGLPLLWWSTLKSRIARQGRALEAIRAEGGDVTVEYARDDETDVPDWLREFLGEELFFSEVRVSLPPGAVDADLDRLRHVPWLTNLDLNATDVTDAGMATVGRLRSLRDLDLSGTSITDAGMGQLVGLQKLQGLSLDATEVTDEGMRSLELLAELDFVSLEHTRVGDAAIDRLSKLPNLGTLSVRDTQVTRERAAVLFRSHPGSAILGRGTARASRVGR
ncbi:MAG: hypothetical protein HQ582_30855 [Planctomycetes bacterium]|nr:hypothetical protein [Planctomycetota bacterium]